MSVPLGEISWERMIQAVENVRNRLMRATRLLAEANVPYAVIGDHAAAAWTESIDPSAVRNPVDVELLIRRTDFLFVTGALEKGHFQHCRFDGIDLFFDGEDRILRNAVRVFFAHENPIPDAILPLPDVAESNISIAPFRVLSLHQTVRSFLISFRRKDRMHLRDFIDIGLVDSTWPARFPPELGSRLQSLLDDPDG